MADLNNAFARSSRSASNWLIPSTASMPIANAPGYSQGAGVTAYSTVRSAPWLRARCRAFCSRGTHRAEVSMWKEDRFECAHHVLRDVDAWGTNLSQAPITSEGLVSDSGAMSLSALSADCAVACARLVVAIRPDAIVMVMIEATISLNSSSGF